ncbi:MAG: GspE/PulE family protein [Aquabacterium sp.]
MSDLSQPSLSLIPLDVSSQAPGAAVVSDTAFAWPSPPFAAYPTAAPPLLAEPCEIEGANGKVHHGRLSMLDMAGGAIHLVVPPARGTLTLRFNQFRRLTLTTPMAPVAPTDPADPLLQAPPPQHCKLTWADGSSSDWATIGAVEHQAGWFLFPVSGDDGRVYRSFVPHGAATQVDIGPRIGQVLVAQKAATEAQVDAAMAEQQALRSRKLGQILIDQQIVTPEQLTLAIDQQARLPMIRIGEALLALGFVANDQLAAALAQQQSDRSVPLGELLVRRGDITREDLQTALARKMGYPIVDVLAFQTEAEAIARVPLAVARRLPALPLMMRRSRVVVALEDPSSRSAIDELEFTAQCKVVPVLARAGTLAHAVDKAYQKHGHETWQGSGELGVLMPPDFEGESANKLLAGLEQQAGADGSGEDSAIEQSDNQLVRLINSMIQEAQAQGVSDIHIECQPGREKVRIRFRKDGVLRPYMELPPSHRQAMVARIKIMCDLDISERRKPQDGKISFSKFVTGNKLELRVATIPTTHNCEDVVMRLLASAKTIPLDQMGLAPTVLKRLQAVIARPYGMVLCVGPTGSGKTTTLHAALGAINTPDRKIWTAEDPVEITQAGLRQVQVNPKIDFTFAKALRAFLRADPDVVMIGEIRDKETAQMAIEASLTGHMVMSTLHTNSAPETVTRLLDMGMDPFNFADSLLAVLAQRLARRLCKHCKTETPATEEQVQEWLADWLHPFHDRAAAPQADDVLADWVARFGVQGRLMHRHAPGCPQCGNSGFAGRVGLHELMTVNRDLRHLIQTGARADDLQKCAMSDSMRTLRQDGIEKMLAGLTTIEEVRSASNA